MASSRNLTVAQRLQQTEEGRAYLRELATWAEWQPQPERAEIEQQLGATRSDTVFRAGALELALGAVILQAGYAFSRHPEIHGTDRHPDYWVDPEAGGLYMEATLAGDDEEEEQRQLLRYLQEDLEPVEGRLVLMAQMHTRIPGNYAARPIRRFVAQLLARQPGKGHVEVYRGNDGLTISFQVMGEGKSGPAVGMWMPHGGHAVKITTYEAIKKAIDRKLRHYKEFDRPLVLAIQPVGGFPVDLHQACTALLGSRMAVIGGGPHPQFVGERWAHNGILSGRSASGAPIRTRLSAVLIYKLHHGLDGGREHRLLVFHHPFARRPLDAKYFSAYPQLIVTERTDESHTMEWTRDPTDF